MSSPHRIRFDLGHHRSTPISAKAERGRFFSFLLLLGAAVFSLVLIGKAADTLAPAVETNATPASLNKLKILTKKTLLPLYVYGDESGRLAHFIASGYMGDVSSLSSLTSSYDASAPASTGRMGHTSLKVQYTAKGKQGWAGIYWLSPANNWGTTKGAGFDLRKATKLTFWARGEKGGERISQFKVGGVNGPFPDSDSASLGPLSLTKDWQQFTINLKGRDLRHIVGGFMFLVRRSDNPMGVTFYLDEVIFRGNPEDESDFPMVKEDADEDLAANTSMGNVDVPPAAKPVVEPIEKDEKFSRIKGLVVGSDDDSAPAPVRAASKPVAISAVALVPVKSGSGGGLLIAEPIPTPGPWLRYRKWNTHEK